MFKNALLVAFLAILSQAASLDEMVNSALDNNYDLKSLQDSIDVATKEIEVSTNWKNPTLTLGINDIQFDDPFKRDLEPMQAQYIGFSQVIPFGNKLEIKENISKIDKKIKTLTLIDKRLKLKSKIYEFAYTILVLERKYILLTKYQKNLKALNELSKALYENGKMSQNYVLNTKIANLKIEIKKENLKDVIDTLYLKLEEITYSKIDKIEASLDVREVLLNKEFSSHPKILLTLKKSEKLDSLSDFEKSLKTSDIKVNIAYFQRDEKYEDYANFSVNIPLSLYSTEDIKAVSAKIKAKEVLNKVVSLKQSFKTKILVFQNNINSAFKTYKLLNKEIIPLKKSVQKNIELYNSLNQSKPQESIKNLNEVISYELEELDEIKKYFVSKSRAIYYTQGKI